MSTISELMSANHRQCDQLLSKAEAFIAQDDWEQGRTAFDLFRNAMRRHFSMEEEVLFPSLEQLTGQPVEPLREMRVEHKQMLQLLSDMEQALAQEDRDHYLKFAEMLKVTKQQHNMKEEQNLYPMSDQTFGSEATDIIQRMDAI